MRSEKLPQNNILDLSGNGKMSPERARLFNQIADGLRREYIDVVNNISKKQKSKLHWFATPFACRNTYVCSVFEDVVRMFFIRSIIDGEDCPDTIIVDTPFLAKEIKPYLPDSVQIKSQQSNSKYYALLILGIAGRLFKYAVSTLLRYMSFKLASLFSENKSHATLNGSAVVIETYIYNNSFIKGEFNDRHFQGMYSYLDNYQADRLLYIPTFYQVYNSFSLYLKAFKSKTNFLFVEEHISLLDIFYPLLHPFKLDYSQSNIKVRGIDISAVVNHSLMRHSTHTSSLYAILKYRFCCNLKEDKSISINQVVRWYENQEIDHGSIMGWRAYSDSLHVVGYMGFFSSSNYLCAYPISVEHDLRITPDRIGVMGEGLIDCHKKFCDSLNLEVVPSFRFASPTVRTQTKSTYREDIKVLVALPISQQHSRTILNVIAGVSSINRERTILFVIKFHPASRFSLDDYQIERNNVQYTVVDDSIAVLFDEVDYVVSTASSTIVEAIMHGVSVILVSSTQSLRESVIPEFVPDILWSEVYSANELYAAITGHKQHGELDADSLSLLNSRIIGLQPNNKNVVNFLGGL